MARRNPDGDRGMNVLVNYATREFARYRRLSSETAGRAGGIDRVVACSPADLDPEFRRRNARILRHPRLGGYGVWKPYVIERALRGLARRTAWCTPMPAYSSPPRSPRRWT